MKRTIGTCIFSILTICLICGAQTKPGVAGHWEGSIEVPSGPFKVIVDIDKNSSGAWIGDIDLPSQGVKDMPFDSITVTGSSITFVLVAIQGGPKFQGKLSDDGDTISGEFSQGANSYPFSLKRAGEPHVYVPTKNAALPENFSGRWEGTLESMGKTLHLVFNLANTDGAASGTIDSPDQGAIGLPMTEIAASENSIKIAVKIVNGTYAGKLSEDGQIITGEWSQGGAALALVLKKAAAKN